MTDPKPSQRERLIAAMIAVSARHGYSRASVARVITAAGVSRATFYECFRDKDDCFRAAYGEVADRIRGAVEAIDAGARVEEGTAAILLDLLHAANDDPAAARVALLEVLAASPEIRAEHERLMDEIEAVVEGRLARLAPGEPLRQVSARALVGGVKDLLMIRVFRGETGRLHDLLDDLLAWIASYALPPGAARLSHDEWHRLGQDLAPSPLPSSPVSASEVDLGQGPLPRGRSALPPGEVAAEHRERIIAAAAVLAREKGFGLMTVADIVGAAGVSREAFYERFRSKEQALLAAEEKGLQESISFAAGEFFTGADWPRRAWNGGRAMLTYISQHPNLVWVDMVESYVVGAPSITRSFDSRMAYTIFLEEGYRQRPEAAALPRLSSEAIAGAILELLRREVLAGRGERVLEQLPQFVYVVIAPFVGPEQALDWIRASSREQT